jgi:hypothetical protein
MGVWFSVDPLYSGLLILHRNIVMSSLLRSEVLVTVAVGSVAVACHNIPRLIAMAYCCDMYNVCVALFVGRVSQPFGPMLVCLTQA